MPNVELAARILEQIEAHPEQHEQGFWRTEHPCNTTMCIAGWACHLSGDEFVDGHERRYVTQYMHVRTSDGKKMHVDDRAGELLDLAYGSGLFYLDDQAALKALRALVAGDPDWAEEVDD